MRIYFVLISRSNRANLSELVARDEIWKRYAPAYSRVLPLVSFYSDSVSRMAGSVEGCQHVLDIGCGPGIISERLAEKGHKVTAIDNDETMLQFASGRLARHVKVRVEKQDATSLRISDGCIDGVVCNNVLYYVDDPSALLQEAYRVLKTGGLFSVSGPTRTFDRRVLDCQMEEELKKSGLYESLSSDIEIIKASNQIIAASCIRNPFDIPELEALLRRTGFGAIVASELIYLGQCYFISARKGHMQREDLLRHSIITQNVIVGNKISIPEAFKKTTIGDYEFYIARTPEEMVEIFSLRHTAYSREGLIESGPTQSPFDFDVFDKNAVLAYARNKNSGRIEATNRLILDSEMGLYSERTFDFSALRIQGRILAEGSRLAANPPGQKVRLGEKEISIIDLVLGKTTEFAKHTGITHIVGLARVKRSGIFDRSGFQQVADIKNVRLKDGKINPEMNFYPVILDVNLVYESLPNQFR